jgi:hypothetical protein
MTKKFYNSASLAFDMYSWMHGGVLITVQRDAHMYS